MTILPACGASSTPYAGNATRTAVACRRPLRTAQTSMVSHMKRKVNRVRALGALALIVLAACGEARTSRLNSVSDAEMERRDELVNLFNEGIVGNATCAELFSYRNAYNGSTERYFDPKLREVGCFGSSSERTDDPLSTQSEVTATTAAGQSRDTLSPALTAEFMQFLTRKLAGTSYSIDSLTTPFGKAQIQTYTYSAESVCRDLGSGKDESELRQVMSSIEILGDPSLDKDVPVYVDAIFEAAKTYVCP